MLEFLNRNIRIFDLRNGASGNPIVIEKIVDTQLFKLVVSVEEPSFNSIPLNVLWICMDPTLVDFYRKVFIRTSKLPGTETRNTWEEITDESLLYTQPQVYTLEGTFLIGELFISSNLPDASASVKGQTFLTVDSVESIAVGEGDPRLTNARIPVAHIHPDNAFEQLAGKNVPINLIYSKVPAPGDKLTIVSEGRADWVGNTPGGGGAGVLLTINVISQPSVISNGNLQLSCVGHYSDFTNGPIVPNWTVNLPVDSNVSIDSNGLLIVGTTFDTQVTVTAQYIQGSNIYSDSKTLTILNPIVLTSIVLNGNSAIGVGNSVSLTCTATFSNGTTQTVTPVYTISNVLSGSVVSISNAGVLHSTSSPATFQVTVNASYTIHGVEKTAVKTVSIIKPAATLVSISVNGVVNVFEGRSSNYTMSAYYSDGSVVPKTIGVTWSVLGTDATINSVGTLVCGNVANNTTVSVEAEYTEGGLTVTGRLQVNIVKNTVVSVSITGAASGNESSSLTYTAFATMLDGSIIDVTNLTVWSSTLGTFTNNVLNIPAVVANVSATVTASYNGILSTKSVSITNSVATPRILYGEAAWGVVDNTSVHALLTHSIPTATGQIITIDVGPNNYGYVAIPSTVANALNVTFTEILGGVPQMQGGWDGATWPFNEVASTSGPLIAPGVYDGVNIQWYIYRTDFSSLGIINYRLDW